MRTEEGGARASREIIDKQRSIFLCVFNLNFFSWHKNMSLVKRISSYFPAFWRDIEGTEGKWDLQGFYWRRKCKGSSCPLLFPLDEEVMDLDFCGWLGTFRGDGLPLDIGALLVGSWQSWQAARKRQAHRGKGSEEEGPSPSSQPRPMSPRSSWSVGSWEGQWMWVACPRLWLSLIFRGLSVQESSAWPSPVGDVLLNS